MVDISPDISGEVEINGIHIHYEYFGKKDYPVVVLQNGVAMETASWYQFLPPVLEKVDVLLWDCRGQGQSTSDDNPYHVEEFADYLKAILEELEIAPQNVNLVGVSFGCLINAEFMRKYPHMVHKAVFSGVVLSNEMNYHYQADVGIKLLERGLIDIWVDSLYSSLYSNNFLKTIESFIPKLKEALYNRYKDRRKALCNLIKAERDYLDEVENYYNDFKKIEIPILVIAGEHDRLTPPFVQIRMEKIFPDVKYTEYSECGHIVFMERPKEFFNQVIDFIMR
jgi:pimeloyl-ACP methyl ester carboxylesterase